MTFSVADAHHLKAAEGWLELGDHLAAFEELEHIELKNRAHRDVLKLRWRIYDRAGKHGNAFTVAEGLTRVSPNDAEAFLWRSQSVRRMKGGSVEQALELLLDAANDFPDDPAIPFQLACYNSLLGKLEEARSWLHIAFEVAERNGTMKFWKTKALDEAELETLRKEVGSL